MSEFKLPTCRSASAGTRTGDFVAYWWWRVRSGMVGAACLTASSALARGRGACEAGGAEVVWDVAAAKLTAS